MENLKLLSDHAKLHIALLGPRERYHIVAKNHQTSDVKNAWLKESEIMPWVQTKNKEGYTCWISLNDKDFENDAIEGVKALSVFWLDIDSDRKDKTIIATEDQLKKALKKAQKIKGVIENEYAALGFLAYSGNGFHTHFPLPRFELPDVSFRCEVNKKMRIFAKNISAKAKVEIDHTYDIRRVTTLIGSLNLKIPDKPLQTRWDREVFDKGYEEALKLVERAREQNKILLESILATNIAKTPATTTQIKNHFNFDKLLKKDEKLNDLYMGNWKKHSYKSRSEAEEALLVKLIGYDFSDLEIMEIMQGSQIGKWQERPDSYREHSLEKAREYEPKVRDHMLKRARRRRRQFEEAVEML